MAPADVARLGIVRSFQISAVFPHLTVLENVRIALQRKRGGSFDFWRSRKCSNAFNDRAMELITDVGLAALCRIRPRSNCPMAASARWKSRRRSRSIRKCCCLMSRPPAWRHEDIERISALIKRVAANRTVLMVEHNLSVVENLCDRITVLTRGRVLAEGDYETVSNNPEVREAYMGVGHA